MDRNVWYYRTLPSASNPPIRVRPHRLPKEQPRVCDALASKGACTGRICRFVYLRHVLRNSGQSSSDARS